MKRSSVAGLLWLAACGGNQRLELYDALDTTTTYDCWAEPAPAPLQLVVGLEESLGTYRMLTCDHDCNPVKVEIATSTDGLNFKGGTDLPADSRGCTVKSVLTASLARSGQTITITEHSVTQVSVGCDRPGVCTQDATVTGTRRP